MSVSLRQDLFAMDRLGEEGEIDAAMGVASRTKQKAKQKAHKDSFARKKRNLKSAWKKERRILALCDTDTQYLHRLSRYLADHLNVSFEIREYSSAERLCAFLNTTPATIVIASGREFPRMRALLQSRVPNLIVLEDPDDVRYEEVCGTQAQDMFGKVTRMNRYVPSDRIVSAILDHCLSCSQVIGLGSGCSGSRMEIYGVYSPLTRCLQSTYAATLAKVLSRRGKVLYMTYEPFASLPELQQLNTEYDFSDFMYFFECYPDKTPLYIEKVRKDLGGVDVIPPAANYLAIRNITPYKWEELFKQIAQTTDYACVVLDLHESMMAFTELLNLCDRMFTVTRQDAAGEKRIAQYREVLTSSGLDEVWGRTTLSPLPLYERLPLKVADMDRSPLAEQVCKDLENRPAVVRAEQGA